MTYHARGVSITSRAFCLVPAASAVASTLEV